MAGKLRWFVDLAMRFVSGYMYIFLRVPVLPKKKKVVYYLDSQFYGTKVEFW